MKGVEGDGDIFNPDNQKAFIDFVLNNTDGQGVHFVMADGVGKYKHTYNVHYSFFEAKVVKIVK